MRHFTHLAKKVGRELFPPHVDVLTPDYERVTEETADCLEILVRDTTAEPTLYGFARLDGRLIRSPQLEDAIRHELRHVAREMGYADKETRRE